MSDEREASRWLRARRIAALLALLLSAVYVTNTWQTLSARAMAQAGRGDLSDRASAPAGDLGAIGAARTARRRTARAGVPSRCRAGADLRRLLLLLAAFALYFLVMPIIGNMVASALFLFAAMWLLSDDPARSLVRLAIYADRHCASASNGSSSACCRCRCPGGVFRQWLF